MEPRHLEKEFCCPHGANPSITIAAQNDNLSLLTHHTLMFLYMLALLQFFIIKVLLMSQELLCSFLRLFLQISLRFDNSLDVYALEIPELFEVGNQFFEMQLSNGLIIICGLKLGLDKTSVNRFLPVKVSLSNAFSDMKGFALFHVDMNVDSKMINLLVKQIQFSLCLSEDQLCFASLSLLVCLASGSFFRISEVKKSALQTTPKAT